MTNQVSILNVVSDAIRDRVIEKCLTEVTEEETELGLVKVGRLQDDPTTYMKNVMVRVDEQPHVLQPPDDKISKLPVYYIGSTYAAHWRRRFILDFQLFIEIEDRDEARRRANVIFSRVQHAVASMPIPTSFLNSENVAGIDDFGEQAFEIEITSVEQREQGGPGTFIWKGTIKVEALTLIDIQ